MTRDYLLAIDQGTTSSRAIVFDTDLEIVAVAQEEFPQIYPAPGWVEHDPEAIWGSTLRTARAAFAKAEAMGGRVAAIGITNQRESAVLWERATGRPIHNAIVWQDRRTADACKRLAREGCGEEIRQRTGLLLDPYFSATKIAWLLDHVEGARKLAEGGKLAFGTIDSFLISRLTGNRIHATDATNASRTSLFDIRTQAWNETLLDLFRVPAAILPPVLDCAADFGETLPEMFGRPVPIRGVAGDQQAALIGQCCFAPGAIKSTYGTGCFVLLNTGTEMLLSANRLLSTVAYRLGGTATYALEGSIFTAGAAIQWLARRPRADRERPPVGGTGPAGRERQRRLPGASLRRAGGAVLESGTCGAPSSASRRAPGGPRSCARPSESVCYQTHDLFAAMAPMAWRLPPCASMAAWSPTAGWCSSSRTS